MGAVNEEAALSLDTDDRVALIAGQAQVQQLQLKQQIVQIQLKQAQADLDRLVTKVQVKSGIDFRNYQIDLVNNVFIENKKRKEVYESG